MEMISDKLFGEAFDHSISIMSKSEGIIKAFLEKLIKA